MPQYGLEYGRVVGHLRPAPLHRPQARAEGAAAGQLRPGGHRPGRHGPRGPSRLDRLGRARQRPQAAHRLRRTPPGRRRNWPTSTRRSPRSASARTSRPPTAIAGPAPRSSSPATRGSTPPPARAARAGNGWGPYEHTPPSQWKAGQNTSESYRRCCTSVGWVAQALALRLMHAEKSLGPRRLLRLCRPLDVRERRRLRQDHQGGDRQRPRQGMGTARPGLGRLRQRDVGQAPRRRSPRPPTAGSSRTTTPATREALATMGR